MPSIRDGSVRRIARSVSFYHYAKLLSPGYYLNQDSGLSDILCSPLHTHRSVFPTEPNTRNNMADPHLPDSEAWPESVTDIAGYNEQSLRTLVRALHLSPKGEFSLILVRCNEASLQERMRHRLREMSHLPIRELVLPASVKTLFTSIKTELGDEQPQALMIFGLESVSALDEVLTSANLVRPEFRKSFAFPLVLWVNDEIWPKLMRLVPDLTNWSAPSIKFSSPPDS